MPPAERQAVEAWAAKQSDKLTFSKAVRHLVKRGLAAESADTAKPRRTK
jgi:hypothetical protein